MIHRNEPPGNNGVTLNGREVTEAEAAEIRKALRIIAHEQVTLRAGEVISLPWGLPAKVNTAGDGVDVVFDFELPEGRPGRNGIDGSGSIEVVEVVGIPYGQDPSVINFGTLERAKLRFYVPEGPPGMPGAPGTGIPGNPVEGYVVGYADGVIKWVPQTGGTTIPGPGGGTTIIENSDTIQGLYAWESAGGGGVVTPPISTQSMFDAATYTAYQTAINGALLGAKRDAAAAAVIAAMGSVQTLTMKRNGVSVFSVGYSGVMVKSTLNGDIVVSLAVMGMVSAIQAADATTGDWTMVITGGTNMARSITLPVAPDASTTSADGFNPGTISLILPRSMDGL